MSTEYEDLLNKALEVKDNMDRVILNSTYTCMSCGHLSNYWPEGGICQKCEFEGEWQTDYKNGEN